MKKFYNLGARVQTANDPGKRLVLHLLIRCGLLSLTASLSLVANEFAVLAGELASN